VRFNPGQHTKKAKAMATVEKQKQKLERMMETMAKEQAKLLMAEKAEQRKKAREAMRQKMKERGALMRSADAHRKIVLGGLVIAAGADDWDAAEIVGALLVIGERMATNPQAREQLRQKGVAHLEQRAAAQAKTANQ
jgi:cell fate regulator YaaT (PSP1 superfamily)